MSIYLNEMDDTYTRLDEWLDANTRHGNKELVDNAYSAFAHYSESNELDEYVVIPVHGYLAITRIVNDLSPIEISHLVQPFDENRVYPLQRIKKEITWY